MDAFLLQKIIKKCENVLAINIVFDYYTYEPKEKCVM